MQWPAVVVSEGRPAGAGARGGLVAPDQSISVLWGWAGSRREPAARYARGGRKSPPASSRTGASNDALGGRRAETSRERSASGSAGSATTNAEHAPVIPAGMDGQGAVGVLESCDP